MNKISDPDPKETCPYDPSHRIIRHKFATHLVKCRRNYVGARDQCLYNSTHHVPKPEMNYHLQTCRDRINLDKHIFIPENVDMNKFCLPKPEIETEENWDDDNCPTYDPEEHCKNNAILRQRKVESAAKRKNFRMEERQRFQTLQNYNKTQPIKQLPSSQSRRPAQSRGEFVQSVTEDDPYSIQKLMEKINLGGQQSAITKSTIEETQIAAPATSPTETWGEAAGIQKEDSGLEEFEKKQSNVIGKGRGRRINNLI